MPPWLQQIWDTITPHVPSIALSLGILVGGWLVALIVRSAVFSGLKRTTIDDRLAEWLGVEARENRIERAVSRFAYWVIMALVVVAFLERLEVSAVTQPIVAALQGLSAAVPNLLKAALIGLVGFAVATVARKAVTAFLDRTGLVARIERLGGEEPEDDEENATSQTIGQVVYWVIIALAVVPVLEALEVGVLAAPLAATLSVIATYLPKVAGAVLLGFLGYFLGRAARAVITAVVDRLALDKALARVGLGGALGTQTPGGILGNLAMVFVFLHFAVSAVGKLDIDEISRPLGTILTQIYGWLPRLLVGALLLAIGVAVARVAARFSRGVLAAIGFNTLLGHIGLYKPDEAAEKQQEESKAQLKSRLDGEAPEAEDGVDPLVAGGGLKTPADIGGMVVGTIIVLLFLRQTLETTGLGGLARLLDSLLGYLPDVLVAAVVLGAGMWAGGWARKRVGDLVSSSDDSLMKALPGVVHVAIIVVAAMIALQQLGVGNQIIAIAFALVLGAVCLALALAFGLGGREVAGKILASAYDKRQAAAGKKPSAR